MRPKLRLEAGLRAYKGSRAGWSVACSLLLDRGMTKPNYQDRDADTRLTDAIRAAGYIVQGFDHFSYRIINPDTMIVVFKGDIHECSRWLETAPTQED